MEYKITIPGELPSMNEIIDASKLHYMEYSKMKKQHTEAVAWIAKTGIGKELKKIDLDITWHCKDRMKDKDNIMAGTKFILDGLKEGGIIKGDGWRHIGDINHSFQVDKDNPRIEAEIKEV
jgi:Holliday junction resolvase RusA-like endonuclease